MRYRTTLLVLLLLGALPLLGFPVTGRVRVTGSTGKTQGATFVYAEPLDAAARPQPSRFTLRQVKKAFQPRILVVPVGSTVQFPNDDEVFHNVFSVNKPEPFDLGLYRSGDSKSQTFTAAATYQVFCNIHPQMSAVLAVVNTTYIAEAGASGSYKLDLPAGRYRITALSERAQGSVEVTVSAAAVLPDITLDESKTPKTHLDKLGKEYPKSAYDNKK